MIATIDELVNIRKAEIQNIHCKELIQKNITFDVLRLDKIHPLISGNKWFKLKYNIQKAISEKREPVITFGGAYSNHILSTAFACSRLGLTTVGIIRGGEERELSSTLKDALRYRMQLRFISRNSYKNKQALYKQLEEEFPFSYIIEEGGCNDLGIRGCQEILDLTGKKYTHVCCAAGTGTMMAGLVNSSGDEQLIVGFSVLKLKEHENTIKNLLNQVCDTKRNYVINIDYHFGGYAKINNELTRYMNQFYKTFGIPTDIVYTGKLFYGISDLVKKDFFPPGSSIVAIHSGGLQGNRSLPEGILCY